jgi:hypothetical protein
MDKTCVNGGKKDDKGTIGALQAALRNDDDYYFSWQSAIAMAVYDEACRTKGPVSRKKLKAIANRGAVNFLNVMATDTDKQQLRMANKKRRCCE